MGKNQWETLLVLPAGSRLTRIPALLHSTPSLQRCPAGSEPAQIPAWPTWNPGDLGIKVPGRGWRGSAPEGRQEDARIPWEWVLEVASLPGGIILSRHLLVRSKTCSQSHCVRYSCASPRPFPPFPGSDEFGIIFTPILPSRRDPGAVPGHTQPVPTWLSIPGAPARERCCLQPLPWSGTRRDQTCCLPGELPALPIPSCV